MATSALNCLPALAQATSDGFADGANDAKIHTASGFVCPLAFGTFRRDAVGEADPATAADFCAYSALDGIYGTITLKPLAGAYDAKVSMAREFEVQENTGGRKISEASLKAAPRFAIYSRNYETSKLEDLHYRALYAGGTVGNWIVEVTIEYAEPRDNDEERNFLEAVYRTALNRIQPTVPSKLSPG